MENNELEEMRAQLATLNEKLEKESIVSDKLISEATKKHISELQRKLIRRIIVLSVLSPIMARYVGLYFALWCLVVIILNIYVYRVVNKGNYASASVTEYTQSVRKALKTFKRINRFMWFFSISLTMLLGIVMFIGNLQTIPRLAYISIMVCSFFSFILWIAYYISNVMISPDVELMLEIILKDLEE